VYAKRAVGIDAFQACQITFSSIILEECNVCYSWAMRAVTSLVTYASITHLSEVKGAKCLDYIV